MDLRGGRSPIEVASWDTVPGPGQRPDALFSASRDGRTLVVAAPTARHQSALYLVRAETGESELLYEDTFAQAVAPRLSPDGLRFAFTRIPIVFAGRADDGLWVGNVGEASLRRLVAPGDGSVRTVAAAWSSNGLWLAFRREGERSLVQAIPVDGGEPLAVGDGRSVDWRGSRSCWSSARVSCGPGRRRSIPTSSRVAPDGACTVPLTRS